MAIADLPYFRGPIGIRLRVGIQDDEGAYLDVNTPFDVGYPDYSGALLSWPTVSVEVDRGAGFSGIQADVLVLDNSPRYKWTAHGLALGTDFGFWDAPLPLTIRKTEGDPGGSTFSGWTGRRVKIEAEVYGNDGELLATHPFGVYRIDGVERRGGEARITLVGLHRVFLDRSAESVKFGGDWFRGMPVQALVVALVRAADPKMPIAVDLGGQVLDLGTASIPRSSSYGQVPGWAGGLGTLPQHWIPRCLAKHPNADYLVVGCEAPGAGPNSGGGIAVLNTANLIWSILASPEEPFWADRIPLAIWTTASTIYALGYRENADPSSFGFYRLQLWACNLSGGGGTSIGNEQVYWPGRDVLRKGTPRPPDTGSRYIGNGTGLGDAVWFGEPAMLAFPQTLEAIGTYVLGYGQDDDWTASRWQGLAIDSILPDGEGEQHPIPHGPDRVGAWSARLTKVAGAGALTLAAFRYAMFTHRTPPIFWTESGTAYAFWCALNPSAGLLKFLLYRVKLSDGSLSWWGLGNMGASSTQLWDRQVLAWALAPSQTSGRKFLVAAMTWTDSGGDGTANLAYATCVLYLADPSGGSGTEATITSRWSALGSASSAPTVVFLWTPFQTGYEALRTEAFTVAVILQRSSAAGLSYGIGIWRETATARWIQAAFIPVGAAPAPLGAYAGPVSSLPFAGFVSDASDSTKFYFVDQTTGLVYSATVNASGGTIVWGSENASVGIHGSEYRLSTVLGRALVPTDAEPRYLWGGAPDTPGELRVPYGFREGYGVSEVRMGEGLYPLLQLSRKIVPVIDYADFSGLKVYDALGLLLQIASRYRMAVDYSGSFRLAKRAAGVSQGTFRRPATEGPIPIESDVYPLEEGFTVREAKEEIVNALDVTPYALASAGEPEIQPVRAAGSTFAGDFIYSVSTGRALRVSLSCVLGGTIGGGPTVWRWGRVLETVQTYLAAPIDAPTTQIRIYGLEERPGSTTGWVVGSSGQPVGAGDLVLIRDADPRTIVSITLSGGSAVITLDGQVGISAEAFAEVSITPRDSASQSDTPSGITVLSGPYTAGGGYLTVRDGSQIRPDLLLRVDNEFLRVSSVQRVLVGEQIQSRVYVTGAQIGTTAANHAQGAAVLAYVAVWEADHLYAVGNTGVLFGLSVGSGVDDKGRTVAAGDGVVFVSKGFTLQPMKHAITRAAHNASITRNGRRDLQIDNRFLSPTLAAVVAETVLADRAEPPTVVEDVTSDLYYWWQDGQTITLEDPRIVPYGAATPFEIDSLVYRFATWKMGLRFRSYGPLEGAGKKGPDLLPAGTGLPAEQDGD